MITFSLLLQYVGYAIGRVVRLRKPLGYWGWFYNWPERDDSVYEHLDWEQGDLGGAYWDDGDDEDEEWPY